MAFHKRAELQAIAEAKLRDGLLLLENRRWSNAYYIAGYSVEIGLKACIARQMGAEAFPDKKFVDKIFTHELGQLIGLAGLTQDLKQHEQDNGEFATNWAIVAQWSEQTRYETVDQYTAQIFIAAIIDEKAGVFPWIRNFW